MALINTTTTGIQGSTFVADGTGSLTVQQNGQTLGTYGNIPAFSAYKSGNQTITYNTLTKVTFDTEEFDTNNNFASSTFTPTVAGYYQINSKLNVSGTASRDFYASSRLYKNGSPISIFGFGFVFGFSAEMTLTQSNVVYMNGTTDYLEIYTYHVDWTAAGNLLVIGGGGYSQFSGTLVRTA